VPDPGRAMACPRNPSRTQIGLLTDDFLNCVSRRLRIGTCCRSRQGLRLPPSKSLATGDGRRCRPRGLPPHRQSSDHVRKANADFSDSGSSRCRYSHPNNLHRHRGRRRRIAHYKNSRRGTAACKRGTNCSRGWGYIARALGNSDQPLQPDVGFVLAPSCRRLSHQMLRKHR
jgi:hypothetical protein